MPINREKIDSDPEYRELYIKYLGTLAVLGNASPYVTERDPETMSCIEACMEDAGDMLKGQVNVIRLINRFDLEPI